MRSWTIGAMLALLPPVAAGQQAGEAAQRIESAIEQARAAGVPEALLRSRVAEGQAKRVPLERIAQAVERRAAALRQAQSLMREAVGQPTQPDLSAAADALEAGIAGQAVAEIARGSRGADRPVALAVLTYLHDQEGLPVAEAVARVQQALARGPDALRTLPSQAAAERGRGRPAGGGPAAGVGRANGGRGGPPAGVPGPESRPGQGRPDGVGRASGDGQRGGGAPGGNPGRGSQ